MFLAPPADRDEQEDQGRAGPSAAVLGKQVAHYDNSDDRDDENAQVANSVNIIARHTRGVVRTIEERHERDIRSIEERHERDTRAIEERHERDMREMREKHERDIALRGEVIRLYHELNAELTLELSGRDI